MTDAPARTPWHLWLVGTIAVLFNFIGVFDFVMAMTQGAKYMASAGMTPAQIAHYLSMPGWMTVVWAVGVFAAFLASGLLLMRRKLALPVFALSLAAFLGSLFTPTSSRAEAPSWVSRWRSRAPSSRGCWSSSSGTRDS